MLPVENAILHVPLSPQATPFNTGFLESLLLGASSGEVFGEGDPHNSTEGCTVRRRFNQATLASLCEIPSEDALNAQRQAEQGWINLSTAAQLLGTTRNTLRDAIERGEISAERPISCGPWILNRQNLQSETQRFIQRVRSTQTHPTIANSK